MSQSCAGCVEKKTPQRKWTARVRASLHPRIPMVQRQLRRGDDPTGSWRHFLSMRDVTLSVFRSDRFVIARVVPTPGLADGTDAQVDIGVAICLIRSPGFFFSRGRRGGPIANSSTAHGSGEQRVRAKPPPRSGAQRVRATIHFRFPNGAAAKIATGPCCPRSNIALTWLYLCEPVRSVVWAGWPRATS